MTCPRGGHTLVHGFKVSRDLKCVEKPEDIMGL